jgi:hypothetical protein
MRFGWIAATAFLAALGAPASAQLDPAFNHLFCYGIHEQPGEPQFTPVPVDIETQLGLEQQVSVMRPSFLCAPAKKTGGGVDPLPPTGVPHFTCYRPKRGKKRNVVVQLTDQFGTGTYTITSRRLLCTPTVKMLGSPSGAFLP